MLKLQNNIALKNKTTIRLGGSAPYYLCAKEQKHLHEFLEIQQKLNIEFKILGGGSNLIIADESITKELPFGVLEIDLANDAIITPFINKDVKMPPLATQYFDNNKDCTLYKVEVEAGYRVPKLLQLCKKNGFTGLEGLVGVPGRIGGAVFMNAGAYKTEIADVLFEVKLFHKDLGILTLNIGDFQCEYRKFMPFYKNAPLNDFIVLSASFIFPQINSELVANTMKKNIETKKHTQPVSALTAGCVFKNPVDENGNKQSAGLLLDKAGLKNISINDMCFSSKHASFLENKGNGKTKDAIELLAIAKDKVLTLFNIQLEEEVKLWI